MILYANILAGVAEIIGLSANYNQLRHTVRTNVTSGVSGWAWVLATGGNLAWIVYGVQKHIVALSLANALLVVIGLKMITHLYKVSSIRKQMSLYTISAGMGLSAIFYFMPEYAGWLALLYGSCARLPQLFRAFNDQILTGLSFGSQIVFTVENLLTGVYAILIGAFPLVVAATYGLLTTIYMVVMVAKKGKAT